MVIEVNFKKMLMKKIKSNLMLTTISVNKGIKTKGK